MADDLRSDLHQPLAQRGHRQDADGRDALPNEDANSENGPDRPTGKNAQIDRVGLH